MKTMETVVQLLKEFLHVSHSISFKYIQDRNVLWFKMFIGIYN